MTERTPPVGDIIHAWTEAEREVWNSWSKVEQDVSRPETTAGCGRVLDALEASAQQVARLQSVAVRGACGGLSANPLLPPEARTSIDQACGALLNFSDWQQHLVWVWFGMARQMAIGIAGNGRRGARTRGPGGPGA